jgi:hypothetical protein
MRIRNSEFGIRNSHPPSRTRFDRREKGAFNGGAWHPDSQRIGVPGILSVSATIEGCFETRSAAQEIVHGGGR